MEKRHFWEIPMIGIYDQMNMASPEALRAQRDAEIKNLAEYRARHLQAIKDWSDPVKREKIQTEYKMQEVEHRKLMDNIPAEDVAVRTGHRIEVTKIIFKPLPKLTLWQKIKRFLGFK